jgi:hypothetical protein
MITRIPQRTKDDCTICVVAMVMEPPYTYERVLEDSSKYPKSTLDRKFPACWGNLCAMKDSTPVIAARFSESRTNLR